MTGKVTKSQVTAEHREVIVSGGAAAWAQEINVGGHRFIADEPVAAGGADAGPGPYDLLLAALGACTSITVSMYAKRKDWPLEGVEVTLRHYKIHAEDCGNCETKAGMVDRIDRELAFTGPLDDAQRERLLDIANKCPVHRTLTSEINIQTRMISAGG